ncbi:MAG: GTP-binding protein [Oscillospiraceae bacterium]|nr:GTP-binding protein [Oscillospiraceae bacterium]
MTKLDIISGFLGAGKTTFVNKLLKYYIDLGLKSVCIVNEFGQTGLDARIIESSGFTAVEMEGGCICCTLKDEISVAIMQVIDTFSPDRIVFEPSGIFIFDNFFDILKSEELKDKCEIGNVITIVDSVNFEFSKATYGSFIYNQIKNAPSIVLSKLEKQAKPALFPTPHSEQTFRGEAVNVAELICDIKNINPDVFIAAKAWDDWNSADFELLLSQENLPPEEHYAHHHSHLHSITIKPATIFTRAKLERLIELCGDGTFGDICRAKGILNIDGELILLNIAMQDVTVTPFKGSGEQTLTLIGNSMNEEEVKRFLNT